MKREGQRLAGGPRKVTDETLRIIQAWMPFSHLARSLGLSPSYAAKLRRRNFFYKHPSP